MAFLMGYKLVKFSSDLGGKQFGIKRILGKPDAIPQGGSSPNAWTPKNALNGYEWVEVSFEGDYDKKKTQLVLHGQMDTIITIPEQTFVFDYKTREALSLSAIKGQTKDSDGNYFRQLVFYKLLLANDKNLKEIIPSLVFIKPHNIPSLKPFTFHC